jgi:carbonic anhydrase
MIDALTALERLRAGNRRFAAGLRSPDILLSQARRAELAAGQEPFAVILGCSDSRVPAEIVFDQGLGDLFVIRVAGNIVAPSQVGSVEFAVSQFGTRLVVVLGHSQCGAVSNCCARAATSPATSAPSWTASARPWRDFWKRICAISPRR